MEAHEIQLTCADIPIKAGDCADIVTDLITYRVTTEFDSAHDLGLNVSCSMPTTLTLKINERLILSVDGRVRLCGIATKRWKKIVFHYFFEGYEAEDGQTPNRGA